MPIKRRLAKRRRASLTQYEAAALLGDHDFFAFHPYDKQLAEVQRRQAWESHRDTLLRYWVFNERPREWDLDFLACLSHVDGGGPGTRPWSWWRYDAPNAGVSAIAADGQLVAPPWPDAAPGPERDVKRGFPKDVDDVGYPLWDTVFNAQPPLAFESEAAYLRRHGLLLPGELERLTADDFEPRTIAKRNVFYYAWPYDEEDDDESERASTREPDDDGESWRGA